MGWALGRPPVVPELRGSHSEASGLIQAPGQTIVSLCDDPSPCAASVLQPAQRRGNERLAVLLSSRALDDSKQPDFSEGTGAKVAADVADRTSGIIT